MISVVIITKNEADNIAKCINSCLHVSDDIIVVDSGSEDDTTKIANDLGATVFNIDWEGYGQSKNYGAKNAKYDWILSIDADEYLSQDLAEEIKDLSLKNNNLYTLNRLTKLGQTWVKHSGWYPLPLVRIYNRTTCGWNSAKVHEAIECSVQCKKTHLTGLLYHESFKDMDDYLNRQEQYAKLKAEEWLSKGHPGLFKKVFGPMGRFITVYLFKKGFLDGKVGFIIAANEAKMLRKANDYYKILVS